MNKFNEWPLGKVPKELERVELEQVKEYIDYNNPRELVDIFEEKIARYTGAEYAISTDSCTNALFLCLKWHKYMTGIVTIPSRTYISVPMQILHVGRHLKFQDVEWKGIYRLEPYAIWDAATRFTKSMFKELRFRGGTKLVCLSFQYKKRIPIGRGGMILTNNNGFRDWVVKARHDGRDLNVSQWDDQPDELGYHMYMTPEDAARGIILFEKITEGGTKEFEDSGSWENYADLSKLEIF